MHKARISFKEKTILNDGLVIERKLSSGNAEDDEDDEDDENIYFAFFNNSYAALYNSQSRFVTKIKTDELESLVENGRIDVMSYYQN
jgi:hypothetical protein